MRIYTCGSFTPYRTSMSVFWPLAVRKFHTGSTPMRPALTSSYQFPGVCTPRSIAQPPPHIPSLLTADGGLTESGLSFTSGASCGHFRASNTSQPRKVQNISGSSLLVASVDKRRCLVQKGWCGAVGLSTLITTRQYIAAIQRYQTLDGGEKELSTTLQRQLLGLCSNHSTVSCAMSGVDCSAMALKLFETIRKASGVNKMEDSLALMNTLANHNKHERVFKTYQMLRHNGLTVTPELLHIVLHSGKHLGKRAFILLLDIKQCSLPPEEEAKFVQQFMESLDPVVFDTYVDIFGTWLEESEMAAAKISVKNVTKLISSLASKCLWRYATLLLRLHSQHVPELGTVVCDCVVRMVQESPALGRDAVDIVDSMSEGQMMSLNSETWNIMLKQCAENNEIHRVSKFYALLHKNKRFISQQVLATVLLMYIHQKKEVEAAAVLKNSLEENPPSLPPLPVLTKLCQALEDANACKELQFTVAAMIENHSLATSCYLSGEDGVTGSTIKTRSAAVPQPTPLHSSLIADSQSLTFTQGSLEAKRISLEECLELQQFEALTDKYSLLQLIERNARQGQFGAVASVLVTLTERQMLYSTCILDEILKGLTLPGVDLALAFWYIVSSFRQCELSMKECHAFHGHCLLSNLGAALLLHCEHHHAWDKGFQVLYCLHVHGIWYINIPRPIAGVLQRSPIHISDCNIALAAVNICLRTNNPAAAIQVLNCCGWVKASNDEVAQKRAEYVMKLLQHCIRNGLLSDAQKCLTELLDSRESCGHLLQAVSSLGSKLIQLMLRTAQEDSAVEVWKTLQSRHVLIPIETFSNLLACFMDKGRSAFARGLCRIAISQGHYGELAVNEDVFTVRLPSGLTRIEVYYLLESHILNIANESHVGKEEQLTILFVPDAGQTLEMVLTKDFVPSLHASFSTHRATISAVSIQKWREAHTTGMNTATTVVKGKDRLEKKHLKHHFRVAVCKGFVALMKPYYQAKRFKTDEDYTHLLRVLSTNYFKSLKSKQRKKQWKFTDDTKRDIQTIVSQVMNRCNTYSKDVDLSFGSDQ